MLLRVKKSWELPESAATDEAVFNDRRRLLRAMGFGGAALGLGLGGASRMAIAATEGAEQAPWASLYPVPRNKRYKVDRPLTSEKDATSFNNFYEFGSHKRISSAAQAMTIQPWQIRIDGMVEQERTIDMDDLLKAVTLEERVYRFRCVEAWSMTVPWSGFPMKQLVEMAKPLSGAKYVMMQTLADPEIMPGLAEFWYPWPYTEGLTIEEATADITFMVTGLYGKPLPKQNGAPLRLTTPWKYGFKQVKSIVRFTFTDERPTTFWEQLIEDEYGFWANVNPEVAHPRWPQSTERVLGTDDRVPTLKYNGYEAEVAHLYKGMEAELGDWLYR